MFCDWFISSDMTERRFSFHHLYQMTYQNCEIIIFVWRQSVIVCEVFVGQVGQLSMIVAQTQYSFYSHWVRPHLKTYALAVCNMLCANLSTKWDIGGEIR